MLECHWLRLLAEFDSQFRKWHLVLRGAIHPLPPTAVSVAHNSGHGAEGLVAKVYYRVELRQKYVTCDTSVY